MCWAPCKESGEAVASRNAQLGVNLYLLAHRCKYSIGCQGVGMGRPADEGASAMTGATSGLLARID